MLSIPTCTLINQFIFIFFGIRNTLKFWPLVTYYKLSNGYDKNLNSASAHSKA